MAKKRKSPKKSSKKSSKKLPMSIDAIIAKDLPHMRVVDRSQGKRSKIAQPDAKAPDLAKSLSGGLMADAVGEGNDDDATFVTVEPKKAQSQDFRAASRRVVLVSKSKRKVIALQG